MHAEGNHGGKGNVASINDIANDSRQIRLNRLMTNIQEQDEGRDSPDNDSPIAYLDDMAKIN
jgi:hypothetical protein